MDSEGYINIFILICVTTTIIKDTISFIRWEICEEWEDGGKKAM